MLLRLSSICIIIFIVAVFLNKFVNNQGEFVETTNTERVSMLFQAKNNPQLHYLVMNGGFIQSSKKYSFFLFIFFFSFIYFFWVSNADLLFSSLSIVYALTD